MRVGMIEPVAKNHLHENPGPVASQRFAVNVFVMQLLRVPHACPSKQFQVSTRPLLRSEYRLEGFRLDRLRILAEWQMVPHLTAELQFAHQRLAEFPYHCDRLVAFQLLFAQRAERSWTECLDRGVPCFRCRDVAP